ncbi:MAG: response regulator transcription factor [Phycisphaerales bacterium]|nr:response regulator transcription factor [Phycisphaerales bacterium]
MPEHISLLLADDHALVRGTLIHRLQQESDLAVVASVSNADEAITESIRTRPDVILMDIDMPGLCCFDAVGIIKSRCPETRTIFLSAFHNDRYIERALAVRAWGYLIKNESEESLIQAIRNVGKGLTYFSSEVQQRLFFEQGHPRLASVCVSRVSILSDRETEVLRYIARGLSQKQMAETMKLSEHTVHRHSTSLMKKLDIHNRVELSRFAIREGLAEA